MTATITTAASQHTVGYRHYHFNCRSSTPAVGEVWSCSGTLWFVSTSGTVVKKGYSPDFAYVSETNGQRIDLAVIDEDGDLEWATHTTTTVGSTIAYSQYVDPTSGNNGNAGTSTGAPVQTIAQAITNVKANWSANGEHRIYVQAGETASEDHNQTWWNGMNGATPLAGRLTIAAYDSGAAPIVEVLDGNDFAVLSDDCDDCGFGIIGIDLQGTWDWGEAQIAQTGFGDTGRTADSLGVNIVALRCTITGFGFAYSSSGMPMADVEAGCGDFAAFVDCDFGDTANGHVSPNGARYVLIDGCTFGRRQEGSGYNWRTESTIDWYVANNIWDASGTSHPRTQLWRLGGGHNATSTLDAYSARMSIERNEFWNWSEGIELDAYADATYYQWDDIHIAGNKYHWGSTSTSHSCVGAQRTAAIVMVRRLRFSNNQVYGQVGCLGVTIWTNSSDTSATHYVEDVMCDQNSMYIVGAGGAFAYDSNLFAITGNAANCIDGTLHFRGNYIFSNSTEGTGTGYRHILYSIFGNNTTYVAKIGTSDWNHLRCNDVDAYWDVGFTSLATWQGATAFDDNSTTSVNSTHNFTTPTSGTWGAIDLSPSADAAPQSQAGYPFARYTDYDGFLVSTTVPDAGAFEYGASTEPDEPTFGGSPYTLTADPGAVEWTYNAATLVAARRLDAELAGWRWTANDATLTYSGAPAPVAPEHVNATYRLRLHLGLS